MKGENNELSRFDIYYPISTKEVFKTEQIWIDNEDILPYLCHISKNLWNEGDYIVRQLFTQKDKNGILIGQYMKYSDLDYLIKNKSENYKKLGGPTSQQILKILDRSWRSFFEAIKDWVNNPHRDKKYRGKPKLPGYKKKDGEFLLVFTNQQCKIKDGYIRFPKKLKNLKIKTRLDDEINVRETRIIPKGDKKYLIEIVYNIEEHQLSLNKDRIIGIDFGLRNIVTISNNIGEKPVCIKGGVLKSINQYYNKKRSKIQSIYSRQPIACSTLHAKEKDKSIIYRKTGPAIIRLTNNRNRKIKDIMHKYSRWIINYCLNHNIGTIVMGHNPGQKQEIDLGKITNQNFVNIPEYLLRKMIRYKGEEIGLQILDQEESHTSKCSFLDEEPVGHSGKYMGKRMSRGLFRASFSQRCQGKLINADVQGAYNIIKKAIPKAFTNLVMFRADGIEDVGLHPIRINPLMDNRNVSFTGVKYLLNTTVNI